jgi:hypothetical protein
MYWQRAALEERLRILREQLQEQMERSHDVSDWLETQITALTEVAASSSYSDYVAAELTDVRNMMASG